jgi:ATP-binding cassette subfamily B protein
MPSGLRSWRLMFAAAWRADRPRAVLVPAVALVAGLTAAGYGLAVKWLVDAAATGSGQALLVAALVLAGTVVLTNLVGITAARMRVAMQQLVGLAVDEHLIELCTGLPDLGHHESRDYLDRMELLRQNRATISGAYSAMVDNLRGLIRLITMSILVGTLDGWLLLLPLSALPAVLAAGLGQRVQRRTEEACAETDRRRRRILALGSTAAPAAELRCYRLGDEIRRRHRDLHSTVDTRKARTDLVTAALSLLGWLFFGTALLGAVALMLLRIRQHQATPGDLALLLTVGAQLEGALAFAVSGVGWLLRTVRAAGHYRWLVDYAGRAGRGQRTLGSELPAGPADLVLDHIEFRYPGTSTPVLHDVSLRLPAGATVAVVGENGAGKTTLVKLLCMFYQPTRGRILLGDTDLSTVAAAGWRTNIAAGFQDFARFEMTVQHSVGVGDLPRIDDRAAVGRATRAAYATDVIDALPQGVDTQLGRSFEHGLELSTGQWQRVALARVAMRDNPVLRILDEPTASLDPDAEYALFRHQSRLAAVSPGTITIFVSHRFSTVRMADLIVVLDGGRIQEIGNHTELLAAGGHYAELYALHAAGYSDSAVAAEESVHAGPDA